VSTIEIHTAGELHERPALPRVTFEFNLSDLLDDPLRKPDVDLVKRDGLDPRMQDFVFCTEGAQDLYADMVTMIERQESRGKDVVVLILCRGGKHRSVAFGDNLAQHFDVVARHHHRHLPIVRIEK
jgi:RNase adaptor protein for sRNA GlmZ degradation